MRAAWSVTKYLCNRKHIYSLKITLIFWIFGLDSVEKLQTSTCFASGKICKNQTVVVHTVNTDHQHQQYICVDYNDTCTHNLSMEEGLTGHGKWGPGTSPDVLIWSFTCSCVHFRKCNNFLCLWPPVRLCCALTLHFQGRYRFAKTCDSFQGKVSIWHSHV